MSETQHTPEQAIEAMKQALAWWIAGSSYAGQDIPGDLLEWANNHTPLDDPDETIADTTRKAIAVSDQPAEAIEAAREALADADAGMLAANCHCSMSFRCISCKARDSVQQALALLGEPTTEHGSTERQHDG